MKNIEFEITLSHRIEANTSRKFVEVTESFKNQVEQFRDDLIHYYKNNADFPITELTEFENNHMNENSYAPEAEKIHEFIYDKTIQIANDNLIESFPYTYVDEYNEFGGDETDLIVSEKLDERYYQYKAIINNIIENNLQSDIWQILDNKTKGDNENKLSKTEANAVAAMIIFDNFFYNM